MITLLDIAILIFCDRGRGEDEELGILVVGFIFIYIVGRKTGHQQLQIGPDPPTKSCIRI